MNNNGTTTRDRPITAEALNAIRLIFSPTTVLSRDALRHAIDTLDNLRYTDRPDILSLRPETVQWRCTTCQTCEYWVAESPSGCSLIHADERKRNPIQQRWKNVNASCELVRYGEPDRWTSTDTDELNRQVPRPATINATLSGAGFYLDGAYTLVQTEPQHYRYVGTTVGGIDTIEIDIAFSTEIRVGYKLHDQYHTWCAKLTVPYDRRHQVVTCPTTGRTLRW